VTLAKKVALNASVLAAGRAAGTLIGIVSIGISTRYLGVDGYWALAAGIAFATTIGVVTDLGIWTIGAPEIAKQPEDTQRILGALLTAGLGLSFAAGLVGVGLTHVVYGGGGDDLTRRAALLFLITVPLLAPSGGRRLHHGAPAGHGWEWSRE
jgi:O-antigen/teichoic acid export membrane protein